MAITFSALWDNYPSSDPYVDKNGKAPAGYSNQCAIRLGTALEKSGVSFVTCRAKRAPGTNPRGGMIASAQELANWLKTKPFSGCSSPQTYAGKTVFDAIDDKTGIVFLANYWQRDPEVGTSARSGDHIDLWNGSRFTSYTSWARIHLGISWDGLWSDYERSDKAIFWHVP